MYYLCYVHKVFQIFFPYSFWGGGYCNFIVAICGTYYFNLDRATSCHNKGYIYFKGAWFEKHILRKIMFLHKSFETLGEFNH